MSDGLEERLRNLSEGIKAMADQKERDAQLASPEFRAQAVTEAVEQGMLGRTVAGKTLSFVGGGLGMEMATALMQEVLADVAPQSAIERMLAEQLLLAHVQTLDTYRKLTHAHGLDVESGERLVMLVGKLQAEFRRTLAAIKDWRSPTKAVIMSKQTNIGGQQIIHQGEIHAVPNEQGTNHA